MTVLVGYASANGSTREIAERIAARLIERGIHVDVGSMSRRWDARAYEAFVIGSAVHDRAWLPDAEDFVHRDYAVLAARPVWMFSVGMQRTPALGMFRTVFKDADLPAIARIRESIHPRDYHYFCGAVYPDQLPFGGRLFVRAVGGKFGDFRSWDDVDFWAEGIAAQLRAGAPMRDLRHSVLAGRA